MAATNKDLAAEVKRGVFRLDLYHRLDVFHLRLPPLRERPEDIVPLANHFLGILANKLGKTPGKATGSSPSGPGSTRAPIELAPQTEAILRGYDYPGNVRELRNIIERAVILSTGDRVEPASIMLSAGARLAPPPSTFFSLDVGEDGQPPSLEALERAYIGRLLAFAGGNRTQVARLLGVSYPTVAKKIADYGL